VKSPSRSGRRRIFYCLEGMQEELLTTVGARRPKLVSQGRYSLAMLAVQVWLSLLKILKLSLNNRPKTVARISFAYRLSRTDWQFLSAKIVPSAASGFPSPASRAERDRRIKGRDAVRPRQCASVRSAHRHAGKRNRPDPLRWRERDMTDARRSSYRQSPLPHSSLAGHQS